VEKPLKYQLRRCEVEAMDTIAENLQDATKRHNKNIVLAC